MNAPFVHLELNTTDPARARAFYAQLLGWKCEGVDLGGGHEYAVFEPDQGPGGGIQLPRRLDGPRAWVPYVHVPSVKRTLARARALGAQISLPYTPVPGFGALAVIQDPGGAHLGLWEVEPQLQSARRSKRLAHQPPARGAEPVREKHSRSKAAQNKGIPPVRRRSTSDPRTSPNIPSGRQPGAKPAKKPGARRGSKTGPAAAS
jgi:hypothetical protein